MMLYKYLNNIYPQHQSIIAGEGGVLFPPIYLTPWCYYKAAEALSALALPGPLPTHVLDVQLSKGMLMQGPAYINPLSFAQVLTLPDLHRFGNGIELALLSPLILQTGTYTIHPLEKDS